MLRLPLLLPYIIFTTATTAAAIAIAEAGDLRKHRTEISRQKVMNVASSSHAAYSTTIGGSGVRL